MTAPQIDTAHSPSRLRPTRAGLVNLWDYTEAEFRFVDGRLVLRGPNGSGKTKALELLFPFLLDANLAPQRLDPFSGTGRTMRDNLLFRPGRETVIGYAWMEFATSDPEPRHVVVGAGLRASRSDQRVTSWYFLTDRVPGKEWSLVDEERRPLTRRQLGEAIGTASVFTAAGDYRRAVDAELFGLGSDRYEALVQLVLFLRRPQLAKDLDLNRLSKTLSAGLRPLDEELMTEGARSFDDLEAVQRELDNLDRACRAAETFMRAYRPYVRAVARGRTDDVLDARTRTQAANKTERTAAGARDQANAEHKSASTERTSVRAKIDRLGTEKDALQRSEAYQAIGQTEDLRARANDAVGELGLAVERREVAASRSDRAASRVENSKLALVSAEARIDQIGADLRAAAEQVIPNRIGDIDGLALSDADAADTRLALIANERATDLALVEEACSAWEQARADLDRAEIHLAKAQGRLENAESELEQAESTETTCRDRLLNELVDWSKTHSDIVEQQDVQTLAELIADDGLPPLALAVQQLLAPRQRAIDLQIADLRPELAEAERRHDELTKRRDLVSAERDDEPPSPPTRHADRSAAAGAPLWRLVDFKSNLDAGSRGRLEAGLQAAGLLDAWVTPDGELIDDLDVFIAGSKPSSGPTLLDVLVVDDKAPKSVGRSVVENVLGSIGLGEMEGATATVNAEGRFRLGPLGGAAAKDDAEYIGTSTRAARRRARLAILDAEVAEIVGEIDAMTARLVELSTLSDDHDTATESVPGTGELETALRTVSIAAATVVAVRRVVDDADSLRHECASVSSQCRSTLTRTAGELSVPPDRDGIDSFTRSLRRFEASSRDFVSSVRERHDLSVRVDGATDEETSAASLLREADDDVEGREHVAAERAHELATIEDSIGVAAAEVLASLSALDDELVNARSAEDQADNELSTALSALHAAELNIERARIERDTSTADEASALAKLHVLGRPELRSVIPVEFVPGDAVSRGPDSGAPDSEVVSDGAHAAGRVSDSSWLDRLADAIDAATNGVVGSVEQRSRTKSQVLNAFQQLELDVGAAHHASLDDDDDITLVWMTDDDGQSSAAAFTDRIVARRDEHRALLSAQERQVLEDTLLDGLCRQIHRRTLDAKDQVALMNRALSDRSTTSGKRVKLSWLISPELSDEHREATKLLEGDPALLSTEARRQVREHLASEIRAERATSPHASYREILSTVLDYRTWRVFNIRVTDDDGEHALTKQRYNKYSGGERATVLHLPLFAAAAAHYDSGTGGGPRLIALDEAFAGIDNRTTAELMALAVEFDLDLFLTGHDLRATFAEVPGVSIVHLTHHRDAHAVSTLHMRWDGHTLEHD